MENKELDSQSISQQESPTTTAILEEKEGPTKLKYIFREIDNNSEEDMEIHIIDKLLTIPKCQKETTLKLKRIEEFWQANLRTVGEQGLNSMDELQRNLMHKKDRQLRKNSTHIDFIDHNSAGWTLITWVSVFKNFREIEIELQIRR